MTKKKVTNLDALLGASQDKTGYIGFPPFEQHEFFAPYTVEVHLETDEDVRVLLDLLGKDYVTLLGDRLRSVKSFWYPALKRGERGSNKAYIWVEE